MNTTMITEYRDGLQPKTHADFEDLYRQESEALDDDRTSPPLFRRMTSSINHFEDKYEPKKAVCQLKVTLADAMPASRLRHGQAGRSGLNVSTSTVAGISRSTEMTGVRRVKTTAWFWCSRALTRDRTMVTR